MPHQVNYPGSVIAVPSVVKSGREGAFALSGRKAGRIACRTLGTGRIACFTFGEFAPSWGSAFPGWAGNGGKRPRSVIFVFFVAKTGPSPQSLRPLTADLRRGKVVHTDWIPQRAALQRVLPATWHKIKEREDPTPHSDTPAAAPSTEAVKTLPLLIRLGVVSLAYFLAQELAFKFPDSFGLIAAIWPAAGIALASLLLSPRRLWPMLLGCLFTAGIAANLTTDRPATASVGS